MPLYRKSFGSIAVSGTTTATVASGSATAYAALVAADTFDRYRVLGSGQIEMGPGSGARDVIISRGAANRLDLTTSDFRIVTAGRGIRIAEGSNARMGTATLVGGTVAVSNTSVTANTRVFLSRSTTGGTEGTLSTTQIASTSFTINSSSGTDTSTVNWMLFEPS